MRFLLIIFIAFFSGICADNFVKMDSELTLKDGVKFLESKPKGLARDFYIWQFLSLESTSLEDATKAYELIHRKNAKLQKLMEKKGAVSEMPKDLYCQKLSFENLLKQDSDCVAKGLALSKIPNLSKAQLAQLQAKVASNDQLLKKIKILSSGNTILTAMLNSDARTFAQIFNSLNDAQKNKIINQNVRPAALKRLIEENNAAFNKMVQKITLGNDYPKFKKSLLGVKVSKGDSYTIFLLGIWELKNKNKTNAIEYFKIAENATKNAFFANKAQFWQYFVSGDKGALKRLSESKDVNIYSIFAVKKLGVQPSFEIVKDFENLSSKKPGFNIHDPFEWEILRENLNKVKNPNSFTDLLKNFAHADAIAHFAFVHNRATSFKNHYFITPFDDQIKWKSNYQKALTYAVARQESNFLPALISTSYALGMMQIMPFNVEPFAKSLGVKDIKLEDMFNPIIALEFGRFYLDELEREFKNPLFVAYAYNGGPGFWRRTLAKKELFKKNGAYEPWISMETISYEESRTYGLKVLANYLIYCQNLGIDVDLDKLLKSTLVN